MSDDALRAGLGLHCFVPYRDTRRRQPAWLREEDIDELGIEVRPGTGSKQRTQLSRLEATGIRDGCLREREEAGRERDVVALAVPGTGAVEALVIVVQRLYDQRRHLEAPRQRDRDLAVGRQRTRGEVHDRAEEALHPVWRHRFRQPPTE